jgi:adenylate cyclase
MLVTGAVEAVSCDHFLFRSIDVVVPSGTSRPVELFELLAAIEPSDVDATNQFGWVPQWNAAIDAFRSRNWESAMTLFQCMKKLRPKRYRGSFISPAASNS